MKTHENLLVRKKIGDPGPIKVEHHFPAHYLVRQKIGDPGPIKLCTIFPHISGETEKW